MLDNNAPVARRTRLKEAEFFKNYYQEKKKKEKENKNGGEAGCGTGIRGGDKAEKSVQLVVGDNKSENLGYKKNYEEKEEKGKENKNGGRLGRGTGIRGGDKAEKLVQQIVVNQSEKLGLDCAIEVDSMESVRSEGLGGNYSLPISLEDDDSDDEDLKSNGDDNGVVEFLGESSDGKKKEADAFVDIKLGERRGIASRTRSRQNVMTEDEDEDEEESDDVVSEDLEELVSSSEEDTDNDDPKDEDYEVDKSPNDASSEGLSSDSGDEKGDDEGDVDESDGMEIATVDKIGKGILSVGVGLNGKKVYVYSDSDTPDSFDVGKGISSVGVGLNGKKVYVYSDSDTPDSFDVGKGISSVGVGLKRKKVFVDLDGDTPDSFNVGQRHTSVALSTRSHTNFKFGNKEKKLRTQGHNDDVLDDETYPVHKGKKLRTQGHHDDVLDDETYPVHRETSYINGKYIHDQGNSVERVPKVCENVAEGLGKPNKRRQVRTLENCSVFNVLLNSILGEEEIIPDELVSSGDETLKQARNQSVTETPLPLKFTFGIEETKPPEKSELDKELDCLWDEMAFALRSNEIDSVKYDMAENEDADCTKDKIDYASRCARGDHELILDEEIGIICRRCYFVEVEIKYVVPPFSSDPWGRSDRRDNRKVDNSYFDGLHYQDSGCDSQNGRHPCARAEGTVWDIIPGIKSDMFQHQREGFEFIWKNIAGGIYLDKLKAPNSSDDGSGCIISHAPGTGKTRLTIIFLQTYMELYPSCRPMIIAPRSMLLTWEEEFRKWKVDIPFHILNKPELSGKENFTAVNFLTGRRDRSTNSIRMVKLYSWKKDRSILGISYRLFEKLAGAYTKKNKNEHDTEGEQVRKILCELPGLLVLDEGHTPRNEQSLIWKALNNIETEKRIILSGTPFQNNFDELYNTLCLVRPKFAEMISSKNPGVFEKKRGRKRSEARGKWDSLTSSIGRVSDDRLMDKRIKEVKSMIDPFVHVHKGTILQESLKGMRHSVVVLQPPKLQKSLLESIQGAKNPIELGYLVSLISVHPSLLPSCLFEQEKFSVYREKLERIRLKPADGVKTKFIIELTRLSAAVHEKVLIFSQYIDPLTFIRDQLKSHFCWTEGREVLYMDGKLDVKQRQYSINVFNDPESEVRVLLASTKACSEGINLVGASRVVLLDVVWNPSVERQAISRAYRLGQTKVVYIYHLITSGTMEGEKHCRQAEKDRLSELVFSSSEKDSGKSKISKTVSEDKILEEMVQHEKLKHMFEKIIYQPKESNLIEAYGLVDL